MEAVAQERQEAPPPVGLVLPGEQAPAGLSPQARAPVVPPAQGQYGGGAPSPGGYVSRGAPPPRPVVKGMFGEEIEVFYSGAEEAAEAAAHRCPAESSARGRYDRRSSEAQDMAFLLGGGGRAAGAPSSSSAAAQTGSRASPSSPATAAAAAEAVVVQKSFEAAPSKSSAPAAPVDSPAPKSASGAGERARRPKKTLSGQDGWL